MPRRDITRRARVVINLEGELKFGWVVNYTAVSNYGYASRDMPSIRTLPNKEKALLILFDSGNSTYVNKSHVTSVRSANVDEKRKVDREVERIVDKKDNLKDDKRAGQ